MIGCRTNATEDSCTNNPSTEQLIRKTAVQPLAAGTTTNVWSKYAFKKQLAIQLDDRLHVYLEMEGCAASEPPN